MEDKNWISSVFTSITTGFSSILASVKKHGWRYAMFTMILITFLWCVIINPIKIGDMVNETWKNRAKADKEQIDELTEESILRRERANYFVSDLMLNIIERYKTVNRVLLLEKHNGSSNLKGVDFLYSSCTYELVNDSLLHPQYMFEDLQKQTNINLLGANLIQTLKHRDYIFLDNLEKQSNNHCRLLRKLKNVGDTQTIIFSFKDNKHRPIIMLVISGNNLDVKSISSYLDQFKRQIEELLID